MAKRRTKKQKIKAKHRFLKAQEKSTKADQVEPIVKGQFKKAQKVRHEQPRRPKKATKSAKNTVIVEARKELLKSLFLASLILGIEVMVYLAW